LYPRAAGICGHRVVPFMDLEQVVPDIKYFTFVREPLERCVSHFLHSQRGRTAHSRPLDLERFCQQADMRNLQCRFLSSQGDAEGAIEALEQQVGFVGRCDRFDESLKMLRAWLLAPDLPTEAHRINSCPARTNWDILEDSQMRALVEEANQEDLRLYRYVTEVLYPRQIIAFSEALEESGALHEPALTEGWWAVTKRNLILKPALHLRMV